MARRAMFAGFLQALAGVYLLSMVEFLVRVQMNVLGRAMYADIVRGDADADAALGLDNEAPRTRTLLDAAERAFLSMPILLLQRGVPAVVGQLQGVLATSVQAYVGPPALRGPTKRARLMAGGSRVAAAAACRSGTRSAVPASPTWSRVLAPPSKRSSTLWVRAFYEPDQGSLPYPPRASRTGWQRYGRDCCLLRAQRRRWRWTGWTLLHVRKHSTSSPKRVTSSTGTWDPGPTPLRCLPAPHALDAPRPPRSDDGVTVLRRLIDAGFAELERTIDTLFAGGAGGGGNDGDEPAPATITDVTDARIPLPNVIALLARQARAVLASDSDAASPYIAVRESARGKQDGPLGAQLTQRVRGSFHSLGPGVGRRDQPARRQHLHVVSTAVVVTSHTELRRHTCTDKCSLESGRPWIEVPHRRPCIAHEVGSTSKKHNIVDPKKIKRA